MSTCVDCKPNVVLTLASTADGFLINSGQVCVAGSRLLVQEAIAPAFIEAVKERFAAISATLGTDPSGGASMQGPMADEAQFNRVMSYIDLGKKFSAPVIGGNRKGDKGFFIEPTLFINPDLKGKVFSEEIFGPVLSIVTFKTEEEAIEMANDTATGLSGEMIFSPPV